jgi:hypothetical protein
MKNVSMAAAQKYNSKTVDMNPTTVRTTQATTKIMAPGLLQLYNSLTYRRQTITDNN